MPWTFMSLKGIRSPVTHIFLGICGAIIYKVPEVQCSSPREFVWYPGPHP